MRRFRRRKPLARIAATSSIRSSADMRAGSSGDMGAPHAVAHNDLPIGTGGLSGGVQDSDTAGRQSRQIARKRAPHDLVVSARFVRVFPAVTCAATCAVTCAAASLTTYRRRVRVVPIRGLIVFFLLTNGGLLTRERESLRGTFRGTERNPVGCARTPNATPTNRERGRRRKMRRKPWFFAG